MAHLAVMHGLNTTDCGLPDSCQLYSYLYSCLFESVPFIRC